MIFDMVLDPPIAKYGCHQCGGGNFSHALMAEAKTFLEIFAARKPREWWIGFSEDDAKTVRRRQISGGKAAFSLANALSRLCTTTACRGTTRSTFPARY